MTEPELQRWAEQTPDRSLDGLVDDVWAGVRSVRTRRAQVSALMAVQAAVLVMALAGAAGGGAMAARTIESRQSPFGLAASLAPSTRLIGTSAWAR